MNLYVFYLLEARKLVTVGERNKYLSLHSINNVLPAVFGFRIDFFKRVAVADVLHNENVGILSHKNKCLQSKNDGVLSTSGAVAVLNERMFLFSDFGASLIGIDMFDRGNVTGDERSIFQDFLAIGLFGMDGVVDPARLEIVLEVEVALNEMRDFRNQETHTDASLETLLDMIKSVQRLLLEAFPYQASGWNFAKYVYMQMFAREIRLCGSAKNIDCGQFERLVKHFTKYYKLTNHNPYDTPRQCHVRHDEECAIELMCLALIILNPVTIRSSSNKGLLQRAEAAKADKIYSIAPTTLADFDPVGLAFPLKNNIGCYKIVGGYPQVNAAILRRPLNAYHANQSSLQFMEYSIKLRIIDQLVNSELTSFKRVQVIGISHTDYSVAQTVKGCLWDDTTKKLSSRFLKVNHSGDEEFMYVGGFFVYTVYNLNSFSTESKCCIFGRWLEKIGMCDTLKSLKLCWEKT